MKIVLLLDLLLAAYESDNDAFLQSKLTTLQAYTAVAVTVPNAALAAEWIEYLPASHSLHVRAFPPFSSPLSGTLVMPF